MWRTFYPILLIQLIDNKKKTPLLPNLLIGIRLPYGVPAHILAILPNTTHATDRQQQKQQQQQQQKRVCQTYSLV